MGVSMEKLLRCAMKMRGEYTQLLSKAEYGHIPVGSVTRLSLSLVPQCKTDILIYRPEGEAENRPVCVNLHAGAWVRGAAGQDDHWSRRTVRDVGAVVFDVDFKLAPEYQFPVALEECYNVVRWIFENAGTLGIDRERISVSGHNTGGNLAAAVGILVRDRGGCALKCAVLDCPTISLRTEASDMEDFDETAPLVMPARGLFFNKCYLGELSRGNEPLASPCLVANGAGLPPSFVLTAGNDPARRDTERYVDTLRSAGVPVTYHCFEGMPHGFNVQPGLASKEDVEGCWNMINEYLKKTL